MLILTTITGEGRRRNFGATSVECRRLQRRTSDVQRVYDQKFHAVVHHALVDGGWYRIGEFSNLTKEIR